MVTVWFREGRKKASWTGDVWGVDFGPSVLLLRKGTESKLIACFPTDAIESLEFEAPTTDQR